MPTVGCADRFDSLLPFEGIAAPLRSPHGFGTMEYITEIELEAPARAAWNVLGQRFGDVAHWSSALDESWLEGDLGAGAERVCRSSQSFGPFSPAVVRERLLEFDPVAMTFRYEATDGVPAMIRHASNAWRVEATAPGRCRIVSVASLRLAWWAVPMAPFLRSMLAQPMETLESELRAAVAAEAERMARATPSPWVQAY